jgi:DNA-binding GntR family transcriptional regulator
VHRASPLLQNGAIRESVRDAIWHMIGSVQQKPAHRLGHDDLADTSGINMVPIREALRQPQAEAQSTLHRRLGVATAKLCVSDCEARYRIKRAAETLARPWVAVDTILLFWKGAK